MRLLLSQVEIKQRLLHKRGEKLSAWLQQSISCPAHIIIKPFGSPGLRHTTADGVLFLCYGPTGSSSINSRRTWCAELISLLSISDNLNTKNAITALHSDGRIHRARAGVGHFLFQPPKKKKSTEIVNTISTLSTLNVIKTNWIICIGAWQRRVALSLSSSHPLSLSHTHAHTLVIRCMILRDGGMRTVFSAFDIVLLSAKTQILFFFFHFCIILKYQSQVLPRFISYPFPSLPHNLTECCHKNSSHTWQTCDCRILL